MKEMINSCMAKHESMIRHLAGTPLGGQRFESLIRRYEMNNEPPPPEEAKSERYVIICHFSSTEIIYF
jgi:protein phosphatase-4 regulatory subunit 3